MDDQRFLKRTIRENIVLGSDFDESKFKKICSIVGLDINKYKGNDLTEIVEGQRNIPAFDKKRILLARVLYMEPDIILINKYFDQLGKDQQ